MKKYWLVLLSVALFGLTACNHQKDKVVAQVYYAKLYRSQIEKNMPEGLSASDSLALVNDFINRWIKEQLFLHEAQQHLSYKEKNFDKELTEYRNNLLVNAYYDKLTKDTTMFPLTDKEIQSFTRNFDKSYAVDKEIVKVNYVKLSKKSKLIPAVKSILFDTGQRKSRKQELVKLMGDSIEYFVDDDTWFYLDDLSNDLPLDFVNATTFQNKPQCVEKEDDEFHYLIVLLDYKTKRSATETADELAAARMMLLQQRKQQYLNRYMNDLYEKAVKNSVVIQ